MCVSTSTLVYLLYAAGDLPHFIFVIDMLDGRQRGEVCVCVCVCVEGGDFLQILFV